MGRSSRAPAMGELGLVDGVVAAQKGDDGAALAELRRRLRALSHVGDGLDLVLRLVSKNAPTSSMVRWPGVGTSSGMPSPVGARSSTGARRLVAFSRLAA